MLLFYTMSGSVKCRGKTLKQCKRAPKSCKRARGSKRSYCRKRHNATHKKRA